MTDAQTTDVTTARSTVVGVFNNRAQAEKAINELERAGFTHDQIGFVMRNIGTTPEAVTAQHGTHAGEDAVSGAIGGGVLGGIIGAAAAILLPGIGPVVAGGILASVFGGVVAGTVAGGLIGALIGMGVPEHEARYYEDQFKAGRPIVTVRANGRWQEASGILKQNGAYDVESARPTLAESTPVPTATALEGAAEVGAAAKSSAVGTNGWDSVMPRYRTLWEQRYVRRWEDYEPAYRYGYAMARNPMFKGSSWDQVEPFLRRDWEARYPDRSWDQFSTSVKEAWMDLTNGARQAVSDVTQPNPKMTE